MCNFFNSKTFLVDQTSFWYTIQGLNSLDLDQNQHFVRPDIGSNSLQNLSAVTKVALQELAGK